MKKTLMVMAMLIALVGCSDDAPKPPDAPAPDAAAADANAKTPAATDKPVTAKEAFATGMKLFNEGNHAEARKTLVQVDGLRLDSEDRVVLWETIHKINLALKEQQPQQRRMAIQPTLLQEMSW